MVLATKLKQRDIEIIYDKGYCRLLLYHNDRNMVVKDADEGQPLIHTILM